MRAGVNTHAATHATPLVNHDRVGHGVLGERVGRTGMEAMGNLALMAGGGGDDLQIKVNEQLDTAVTFGYISALTNGTDTFTMTATKTTIQIGKNDFHGSPAGQCAPFTENPSARPLPGRSRPRETRIRRPANKLHSAGTSRSSGHREKKRPGILEHVETGRKRRQHTIWRPHSPILVYTMAVNLESTEKTRLERLPGIQGGRSKTIHLPNSSNRSQSGTPAGKQRAEIY